MKKQGLLLAVSMLMSGCTFNGFLTPSLDLKDEELKFAGIPFVIGMSGSSVRIDDKWVLTSAHNDFILESEWFIHPSCDIAIFKDEKKGAKKMVMEQAVPNEEINSKGFFSVFMMPTKTKGIYTEDFYNYSCEVGLTNAPIGSGMSGGGTYNADGNLLGINMAVVENIDVDKNSIPIRAEFRKKSMFVPVCTDEVSKWIENITGEKYCK